MHEGGVRTVLQQATHQIGQQVAMRADGGVDAAAGAFLAVDDLVQTLAHAMQALELVGTAVGHLEDRRDRMGVMGRELRIDSVGVAEQLARIGKVADIGRSLRGEQREVRQAFDLRQLHLGVPIGALHQTHHDLAVELFRQRAQPVDHEARAFAVSLHDDAEPVPAGQLGIRQNLLDDLERDHQTVLLLGVDVEAHVPGLRGFRQILEHRHDLGHGALFLGDLVARMQRRELHRDAGIFGHGAVLADLRDGGDRIGIILRVALGVARGASGLAQHVVAVGIAAIFELLGTAQCVLDRLAEDELAAHFLHRAADGGTDHRLAQTAHGPTQHACHAGLFVFEHAARQHQRPGRGVDHRGRGGAHMLAPVGRRDLVFDQRVDRFGIGHAQHRFGQTHQRHAFLRGQAIFREEMLHQRRFGFGPDAAHELCRAGRDLRAITLAQFGLALQALQKCGFIGEFRLRCELIERVAHAILP